MNGEKLNQLTSIGTLVTVATGVIGGMYWLWKIASMSVLLIASIETNTKSLNERGEIMRSLLPRIEHFMDISKELMFVSHIDGEYVVVRQLKEGGEIGTVMKLKLVSSK